MAAVGGIAAVATAICFGLSGSEVHTFWPLLLWPALVVARIGLSHTWIVVAVLAVAVAIRFARKPLRGGKLVLIVIAGVLYGAAGFLYPSKFPVPNVAPVVSELDVLGSRSALQGLQYRKAFEAGYRDALVLGCFTTAHGSSGYVDGYWAGATMGLSELARATSGWAVPNR